MGAQSLSSAENSKVSFPEASQGSYQQYIWVTWILLDNFALVRIRSWHNRDINSGPVATSAAQPIRIVTHTPATSPPPAFLPVLYMHNTRRDVFISVTWSVGYPRNFLKTFWILHTLKKNWKSRIFNSFSIMPFAGPTRLAVSDGLQKI